MSETGMSDAGSALEQHDVVVVGGGPVGLTLALGLARAGLDVLVLERDEKTSVHSRAPALWPGTQEALADLGLAGRFAEEGICLTRPQIHDADHDTALLSLPLDELAGETDQPRLLIVPQSQAERLLYEEIRDTVGVEVRFGAQVCDLIQDSFGVDVVYRRLGHEERVRAKFVAGCDGAQSVVRDHLGAKLEGRSFTTRAALVDVELPGLEGLSFPRFTTTPRLAFAVRLTPQLWRLVFPRFGKGDPERENWVGKACERLFAAQPEKTVWLGDYRLRRQISSNWVNGRIVLAGDAAHLNTPVTGEGINAGIEDAQLLTLALVEAVSVDHPQPLVEYVANRRRAVEHGVNIVTDTMLRLLFMGRGWLVRPTLAVARAVLSVPAFRRKILRRMARIDRR